MLDDTQYLASAVRDGEPVTKSVLEPSSEAPIIKRYLQQRAAGQSRKALKAELGLTLADTTLIGIEWNALTYAGHTVWNVHNEFKKGEGYKAGQKRRPRDQRKTNRDTHPALITDEEAELLLGNLETNRYTPASPAPKTCSPVSCKRQTAKTGTATASSTTVAAAKKYRWKNSIRPWWAKSSITCIPVSSSTCYMRK